MLAYSAEWFLIESFAEFPSLSIVRPKMFGEDWVNRLFQHYYREELLWGADPFNEPSRWWSKSLMLHWIDELDPQGQLRSGEAHLTSYLGAPAPTFNFKVPFQP